MAGVPEGIDTEKSSIIGRLTRGVVDRDCDIDPDEFHKRVKKDKACRSLLNLYTETLEIPDPTPDQIRSQMDLLESTHRELISMLNHRPRRLSQVDSLWSQLKSRIADLKHQMEQEGLTEIRVKFGSKFLRGEELPRISIDSLRSRLEKQTGIELSLPPHLE